MKLTERKKMVLIHIAWILALAAVSYTHLRAHETL